MNEEGGNRADGQGGATLADACNPRPAHYRRDEAGLSYRLVAILFRTPHEFFWLLILPLR